MTSHKIGLNLRVSGNCNQGGRKYMEDTHATRFIRKDGRDYEFAYFGIFDGHGGPEASRFARDNLLEEITKYECFWSEDDDDILYAIKTGFLDTHQAMWKQLERWPKTMSGFPSTSGTTASIAIIKNSKLYVGHVGDSGIVLGCDHGPPNALYMKAKCVTKDHKPDSPEEKTRIEQLGGAVVAKSGVQRVVWSRPKMNHKGPVRRSTHIDKIPFLAVARSLGDLWSYDYFSEQFVVSPEPDVSVHRLDPTRHKCMILASDGLWNMLTPDEAVSVVTDLELHFEEKVVNDASVSLSYWINPAERLVTRALNKWRAKMIKADNTSAIVVLLDPLGPSKLTLLKKLREDNLQRLKEMNAVGSASPYEESKDLSGKTDKDYAVSDATTSEGIRNALNHEHNSPSAPMSCPTHLSARGDNCNCDLVSSKNTPTDSSAKKPYSSPSVDCLDDSVQLTSAHRPDSFSPISQVSSRMEHWASSSEESGVTGFSKFDALMMNPTATSPVKDRTLNYCRSRRNSGHVPPPGVLQNSQQKALTVGDKEIFSQRPGSERLGHMFKSSRFSELDKVFKFTGHLENRVLRDDKKNVSKCKHNGEVISRFGTEDMNNSKTFSKGKERRTKGKNAHGLAKKTRHNLRHVKDAARRAVCLENSLFIGRGQQRLNGVKRKLDNLTSGPVAKRLRRSDGHAIPL